MMTVSVLDSDHNTIEHDDLFVKQGDTVLFMSYSIFIVAYWLCQ